MPIPPADKADIAEQARLVDAGIDELCDVVPDELGETRDADAGDALDQQRAVPATMTITRRLPAVPRRR